MAKEILIKPVITDKSTKLQEKRQHYTFVVHKEANKIEIASAIKAKYNVTVESVNTLIMPAKAKNRNTKTAIVRGRRSAYKKAIITLAAGETIEILSAAE
jgi:large subunit ribosomal protein L23